MQVQAKATELSIPARKLNLVAKLVQGRSVADGLVILEHTPKRAAKLLAAVIKSAQANAENNHHLSAAGLTISTIQVGSGGMLKRSKPRAFGKADIIKKRLANVRVVVEADEAKPQARKG